MKGGSVGETELVCSKVQPDPWVQGNKRNKPLHLHWPLGRSTSGSRDHTWGDEIMGGRDAGRWESHYCPHLRWHLSTEPEQLLRFVCIYEMWITLQAIADSWGIICDFVSGWNTSLPLLSHLPFPVLLWLLQSGTGNITKYVTHSPLGVGKHQL